jgi:antitoxin component YwqK of YwqJK toxin-antitoxin module
MLRILESQLRHNKDDLFYYRDEPFTGTTYQLAPEGWLQSEQEYRDGMAEGAGRGWFNSSQPESEAHFSGGLLHGLRQGWHEMGGLAYKEMFEYGVRTWGKSWDEAGALTEDFHLQESDPDYQVLLAQRRLLGEGKAEPERGEPT